MDVAYVGRNANPEETYKKTVDRAQRRRIQAEVVDTYRDQVARYVRRSVPLVHRVEAEQVGVIGLLVGLEKYDPEFGPDSGLDRGKKSFWGFVFPYVRDEIQRWMDSGVYWRRRARNARNATDGAKAARKHASMDAGTADETLHDLISELGPTVEDVASEIELHKLLRAFTKILSPIEVEILLSEDPRRRRSRRYLILVDRLRVFVRGEEDDGFGSPREPLSRHSDAARSSGAHAVARDSSGPGSRRPAA